ncbi:MAG: glutamine--fructose-6-phosphate transaminase (isomerizing), partial [Gemmatimonadetes bacterium]|nr:glutamine--fructose-6-phosphate transaminase (isomerizing) [Gemmatimonadota bacterium]
VGYVGGGDAAPFLLSALHRLEYRGYDSAGLAVVDGSAGSMAESVGKARSVGVTEGRDGTGAGSARLVAVRRAGRIAELERALRESRLPQGGCGVAHTRWATHGPPTRANAHPQLSADGEIAVVHNGIIENASLLRERLGALGYAFTSDTDTETLAHLVDHLWSPGGPLEGAVAAALDRVEGTYGIAVVSSRDPGKIVAASLASPILVARTADGISLVASDAAAVADLTRSVTWLDDGDYSVLTASGPRTFRRDGGEVKRAVHSVSWDAAAHRKGDHSHFMRKEILEQPASLRNVMRGRLLHGSGDARLGGVEAHGDVLERTRRIVLTACGTSWHAALIGAHLLEELARVPVSVEYASELRYRNPVLDPESLVIAISQSGETADTIAALDEVARRGAPTMGVVNRVGSAIARRSDFGLYLHAGPEIGVASTKAFTSQLVALVLFALHFGRRRHLSVERGLEIVAALEELPDTMNAALAIDGEMRELAKSVAGADNFLYLGRGLHFPVALEGALKLKEVSYIHAEGYPAAEMKHGPIALVDRHMPVVVLAPRDGVYPKVVSNIEEIRARGGRVIAVVSDDAPELEGRVESLVRVPRSVNVLQPILSVVPLQLLAYHVAVERGLDVDRPRNLAKSVTVE